MQNLRTKVAFKTIIIMTFFYCGPPKPTEVPKDEVLESRSLDEVKKALESDQTNQRALAVSDTLANNYKSLVPKLLSLLESDPEERVRAAAAVVLANFNEEKALPFIVKELRKPVQSADFFIQSFGLLAKGTNCDVLVPYLKSDLKLTRLKAIQALDSAECKSAGAKVLTQAKSFTNKVPILQNHITALGKLSHSPAAGFIEDQSKKLADGPALAAAYLALGRINAQSALPTLVSAVSKPFPKGSDNAASSLILLQNKLALKGMFEILEKRQKAAYGNAVKVIIEIPDEASGQRALQMLDDKQTEIYSQLGQILGPLKYKPATKSIARELKDSNNPGREYLARALGWINDPTQVKLLISILEEPAGEGRYGAAWSLGVMQASEAVPALEELTQSEDKKMQMLAIEALAMIASPTSLPALKAQLKEDNPMIPFASAALIEIDSPEAIEILKEGSLSSSIDVRRACIKALGDKRDKATIPHFITLLSEANAEDINLVYNALRKVTGESYRSRNEWLLWYQNLNNSN